MVGRTFAFLVESAGVAGLTTRFLLLLLALATLVKVLDDDADEHVEHEEADEQQERDEVEQAPLVVVAPRLHAADTAVTDIHKHTHTHAHTHAHTRLYFQQLSAVADGPVQLAASRALRGRSV